MKRLALLLLSSILILISVNDQANAASVPDPPTNLTTTAVSPTQINLFWSAPSYNGDSTITGYKIEYKIGSGSYAVLVENTASTSTTYSHAGLTTSQSYSYRISAINAIGTSTSSTEASATPTSSSSGTLPSSPTNLSAIPVSPTQVNLFWSAPSNNGGYPITGYKIEYRIGSGSYSTLVSDTGSTSTTFSHTGLTTNQAYLYRVYAITSFGTSEDPSPEAFAQPKSTSTLNTPSAPTNLSATAVSPTQISLSWTTPSNNGGAVITGYKIEVKSGSGSYTTLVSNTQSTTTTYSHAGLATGTAYTYKVSAINSAGASTASNESSATPTSSSSSGAPGAPTNLSATAVSGTQINLSWNAPSNNGGYPITGYKIEYRIDSGSYTTLVSNTQSTTTTYSHTGLTSGQLYVYRVSAINSVGTGSTSSESSATPTSSSSASTPGTPTGLTATAASPTQINLSWNAPSSNGGSAITGYKIEVKSGSGSYTTLVSNTQSTATSFSHTGLTTGTTYYYRVSAINAIGTGASTEASAVPKETTTPTLTATAVSPTSITLSWVPPSQTYKQAITGYKIQEKIATDTFVTIEERTSSTVTTYTITGLTTGDTYTYVVSAHFSLGASPISNEASATPTTTSAPPPSQPTTNPPGMPTSLAATPTSPTQINLTWNAPSNSGGSPITGYKIEVRSGTSSYTTLTSTQNSTTKYSHTGLTTGTTYSYRISAINSVGIGSPSSESSATPTSASAPPPSQTTKPSPPTLSATLISPTQINLSWTPKSGDSAITSYKIEYKIGSDQYRTLTSKATTTTYSHTGLLANTYSYRVYAINSAGTSSPSNEVSIKTSEQTPTPPEETKCGPGTVLNNQGVCVLQESEPEPEPEQPGSKETHIPGFPDPEKDPQYYINRYNTESTYKEWFDRNFPDQTIYEVVGVPEPEPQETKCGPGTHLENGICVLDETQNQFPLSGCLIATATYGTELAPQVQQLREIREHTLLSTSSGTAFLGVFNYVYYSFSPIIADWERQNPAFKELVKVSITPMLLTLSILNNVEIDSEQSLLGYGMGIILLNVGMYFGIPAFLILFIRNKTKCKP
ncbi:fibronectin type III domain-containing protein [Candidatus Parcubacteria bacterium]|nr:MAG: fibronectin type III domain-containing protein [Candidatus Parcubacteria bacterium]